MTPRQILDTLQELLAEVSPLRGAIFSIHFYKVLQCVVLQPLNPASATKPFGPFTYPVPINPLTLLFPSSPKHGYQTCEEVGCGSGHTSGDELGCRCLKMGYTPFSIATK